MTLADFYEKHGIDGLRRLADGAGTDLSYIRALLYSPTKNPSLKMAIDLVVASENELTFEGLAYPKGGRITRAVAQRTARILASA